jgi:Phosphopantetheine attachment site
MTAHKVDSPSTDSSSDSRSGETLDIIARETGIDRSLLLPDATIEALGVASLDLTLALFELEKHFDIDIPVVAERASDGTPQRRGVPTTARRATISAALSNSFAFGGLNAVLAFGTAS